MVRGKARDMDEDKAKEEALQILGLYQEPPRLVVFDLDYTLWPFYCMEIKPRNLHDKLRATCKNHVRQSAILPTLLMLETGECCYEDEMPYLYPEATGILHALKDKGISMAVASRSPTPQIATAFLHKLGIHSLFVAQEIFSSWTHKTEHFQRIHRRTGVPFDSMLFFDDEDRNIDAVSKMGVTSILVDNGVNLGALRQGLSDFCQRSSSSGRNKRR